MRNRDEAARFGGAPAGNAAGRQPAAGVVLLALTSNLEEKDPAVRLAALEALEAISDFWACLRLAEASLVGKRSSSFENGSAEREGAGRSRERHASAA